ncbi:CPBP family intramembrane metalloprotease (plasmid) [Flammeovirga pectinis]|uniref:CPBP family intramembrane metalloprotease n=1 Tax=Flammeovirga pectinis TaxID=2494373 RepID=A0A3Q9FT99_9BACT|nr:CPBP family glutamic-type intramembrane protease [Flammeovirga pectinis]AZQ65600.1 CPBP family intramembrane metalloprotease [Flammeovirga pectinis]
MKNFITILIIGLIGVTSLIFSEVQYPPEILKILSEKLTPIQIKLLILINPTILIIMSTIVGTLTLGKTELVIFKTKKDLLENLKLNIILGVLLGVFIVIFSLIYQKINPNEFEILSNKTSIHIITKLLYGGISEEIIFRFGVMTFISFLILKIKDKNSTFIYVISILTSSVLFSLSHLPILFQAVSTPSISSIIYIILGNFIPGCVYGFLFWKQSLINSIITHIITHISSIILLATLSLLS